MDKKTTLPNFGLTRREIRTTFGSELRAAIRPAVSMLIAFTLITGIIYPLTITGLAQLIFPHQANGSLIREGDHIVGSELIGQGFAKPGYFHSRPSAAGKGYDATASSGSNLGPTSRQLADNIRQNIAQARGDGISVPVPADMVTASGSGLDPDISPANARAQAARIARVRGLTKAQVQDLIDQSTIGPTLGLLGEAHVNVLALNRQLDAVGAKSAR